MVLHNIITKISKKIGSVLEHLVGNQPGYIFYNEPVILPFKPVSEKPYIFVSHEAIDAESVFHDLAILNKNLNIWYHDDRIPENEKRASVESMLDVEEKIEYCSVFVVFISELSIESQNIRNEINFALYEKKPIIVVYLYDTKLKYRLELTLDNKEAIHKYNYIEEQYINQLEKSIQKYLVQ